MATGKANVPFKLATAAMAALLVALGFTFLSPAPAQARSCDRIGVTVSKRVVKPGNPLRVTGRTCGRRAERPRFVRIKLRTKRGWRQIGVSRTRATGRFSRRVRVKLPQSRRKTRLKVIASGARSRSVPLKMTTPGPSASTSACPLNDPNSEIGLTVSGCSVLSSDTAEAPDPSALWGRVECASSSRHQHAVGGGDLHPTATGASQGNDAYRRLTTFDGDDFYGERCELGRNDHKVGPTAFYREGTRRATFFSVRLPANFPLEAQTWQTVMQMKQAQPSDNGGGVPILEMQAYDDEWHISGDGGVGLDFPAQRGVWTRFVWDVHYSQDPNQGWLQVSADLNADGDVDDPGERTPRVHRATLKTETDGSLGTSDGLAPGDSIPSHLRMGIYHNSSISCPASTGCSAEIDNVQVLGA